ncbi:MAG: hypothetical protein HYU66_21850 [Armatimonadetes bacterium]|nr:hypothetical protein [Armatimonadota bacterium]
MGILALFVGVLFSGAVRGSADQVLLGFEMALLSLALWIGLWSVDEYLDEGFLPRRRLRAARRDGAGAPHCLPVQADVSGLQVGRTHPSHVDWWQIRGVDRAGDAWEVLWTGGRFRFDPDAAGDHRLLRVILTILEARSRGYLLPDQPDYSVPEGAISPARMTADEERAERGISEAE